MRQGLGGLRIIEETQERNKYDTKSRNKPNGRRCNNANKR